MNTDFETWVLDEAVDAYAASTEWSYYADMTKGEFRDSLINSPKSMQKFMENYWRSRLDGSPS